MTLLTALHRAASVVAQRCMIFLQPEVAPATTISIFAMSKRLSLYLRGLHFIARTSIHSRHEPRVIAIIFGMFSQVTECDEIDILAIFGRPLA